MATSHLCLPQSIEYAQKIKAKQTFLIHMTHDLEHEETEKSLPPGIRLAYDGLELEII